MVSNDTNGSLNGAHAVSSTGSPNIPATDASIYDHFKEKWAKLPTTQTEWLQRAVDVADILAVDAVQRDKENKSPRAEIALLKHSGLLRVLGPTKYGGGEQPWAVAYKLIREVAKVDGHDILQIQDFDNFC
jgi:alkylation response protein AidB-like acyl-CoA dehydrogenase